MQETLKYLIVEDDEIDRLGVLFIDIEMPGISGLQLVKKLSGEKLLPVFITSHPEFAIESYEIEAFDYLLKPLAAERTGIGYPYHQAGP